MPERHYTAGYKNPPKKNQFKKGQSGNPKGRPKGSGNLKGVYKDLLEEEITITEGGKQKTVTTQEAIARRIRSDALKGKDKAIDRIFEHAPKNEDEEERYTLTEWADTWNWDALSQKEMDMLIKLLNVDEETKRKGKKT